MTIPLTVSHYDKLNVTQLLSSMVVVALPPLKTDKLYQLFIGRSDGANLCFAGFILQTDRSYGT